MKDYLKSALVCDTELMGVMSTKLDRVSYKIERRGEMILEGLNDDSMDIDTLKVHIHWLKKYKGRVSEILDDLDYMVQQIEDTIEEM